MEYHQTLRVGADLFGRFQSANRGFVAVDFRIAFVGENDEVVFLSQI